MKLKSKIRLFSTAWLLGILLLLSAAIYFLFVKTATDTEIEALEREAKNIESSLVAEEFEGDGLDEDEEDGVDEDEENELKEAEGILERYVPEDGMVRIFDEQYRVLAVVSDENSWKKAEPLKMDEGSAIRRYDGEQVAVVYRSVTFDEGSDGIVEITASLEGVQENARVLLYILLFTTLLALFLSLVGGGLLAKVILRPITSLIGTMEDIRRKGTFKKIPVQKKTKDELYQMTVTFNEMIDQLQENFEKQQRFVSDASHELSTPLTVIESYAKLLKRWGMSDPDTREEAVEAIYTEAVRMKGMTDQFLTLASEEHGGKLELQTVELVAVCRQVAKWMTEVRKRDISFKTSEKSVFVEADEQKMKQVLFILIDNAIKYSTDKVEIDTGTTGENAYFAVKDYGEGIPQSDLKRVFERFYRVDKARSRSTGGTGLGLSIAQTIVKAHGGTIDVESEKGKGTTFTVFLPRRNINN